MDQDIFRRTYREVNTVYCAFEKSVLTNQCGCRHAARFCIAEREGVRCRSERSQARCLRWLEILCAQARFILRTEAQRERLPHAKAIRLQVGGLHGVADALRGDAPTPATSIDDVDQLLDMATQRFGKLESLPFSRIMQAVAAYQGRRSARRTR